jgi:hypothetical protein
MLNKGKIHDVLLLIFVNKQDLPNANFSMNASETDKLGLQGLHWQPMLLSSWLNNFGTNDHIT